MLVEIGVTALVYTLVSAGVNKAVDPEPEPVRTCYTQTHTDPPAWEWMKPCPYPVVLPEQAKLVVPEQEVVTE